MRRRRVVVSAVVFVAASAATLMLATPRPGFAFIRGLPEVAYVSSSTATEHIYTAKADFAAMSAVAESELLAAGFRKIPQRGSNLFFVKDGASVAVLHGEPASLDSRYDALPGGYFPRTGHVTVMVTHHGPDRFGIWLFDVRKRIGL